MVILANDVRNDFNGDGRSDILWRNDGGRSSATGSARPTAASSPTTPMPSPACRPSWQVAGTGDFNGDGRDDMLWRNDRRRSRATGSANANGGFVDNDANAFDQVPTSWQVAGTGDFNGDGRDDILWRNDAGAAQQLAGQRQMAASSTTTPTPSPRSPTNWHVAGTGDFNGDGRDDILWRNDSGAVSDWLGQANGGFAINDANAFASRRRPAGRSPAPATSTATAATTSCGAATPASSATGWATPDGGFVNNDANAFATVATNWQVVAIGDYNGDGRDDILWRSDSGRLSNWLGTATGGFINNDCQRRHQCPHQLAQSSPSFSCSEACGTRERINFQKLHPISDLLVECPVKRLVCLCLGGSVMSWGQMQFAEPTETKAPPATTAGQRKLSTEAACAKRSLILDMGEGSREQGFQLNGCR